MNRKTKGQQPPATTSAKRRKDDEKPKSAFEGKLEKLHTQSSSQVSPVKVSPQKGAVADGVNTQETSRKWEAAKPGWMRPALPADLYNNHSVAFQVVDLDYVMDGAEVVVRLFGVTMQGNSVCAMVRKYRPYFYALAPADWAPERTEHAVDVLDRAVRGGHNLSSYGLGPDVKRVILDIECVRGNSLYHYTPPNVTQQFLKIYVATPRIITNARNVLLQGIDLVGNGRRSNIMSFEANLDFEVRFMADIDLVGCGWVEVPVRKWAEIDRLRKQTHCQLEFNVDVGDLLTHEPVDEWSKIAPLRTLSFDIEVACRRGIFPEASIDPVIQIACMVKEEGNPEPSIRVALVVGTCSHVIGSQLFECAEESELLVRWADLVRTVDPDIITGYNIQNFDLPYILDRAKHCKNENKVALLGRVRTTQCRIRDMTMQSRQMGNRTNKMTTMEGRIVFDVLQLVLRDYKLRSYTLNNVSYQFLGEQKEDVDHNSIADLHNGESHDRRRLAVYCMKDAYLPLRLIDKLMLTINYIEMARVTGVPLNFLVTRGQQVKVVSQLLRKTKQLDLFMPVIEVSQADESYEGATVLDPLTGFYNEPIATLDFASLYPSIMIAHNLCYTTMIKPEKITDDMEKGVDYIVTPSNNMFVTAKRRPGLLPQVLQDLLAARKKAKADLKQETDPLRKMVLNGRQLALKISANSVYGFTGATVGKLPALEISQSVTAFGRQMIDLTKNTVEALYKKGAADGKCKKDAVVIYGDTDSVMVKFGVDTVAEAMELGQHAAAEVSKKFIRPISLEFEKVYFPYLLINKKRYAGLYWTKPDKHDKMDCKGLETVRRDNCPLVAKVVTVCLEKLMLNRNAEDAIEYSKRIISDLLRDRIDISMLIISKELTRKGDNYQAKQAHVELAERMRKRDPGSAPRLGDRVPYVIVNKGKGVPAHEKAEDPIFVLQNSLPIDTEYYLHNQLVKPLARILDPVFKGDAEKQLLTGAHTTTKKVATSKVGGLVGFTTKRARCLGCNGVLPEGSDAPTCDYCRPKLGKIYAEKVTQLKLTERRFARLWAECQSCAGSLQDEVFCSARDCPIFYMREKVRSDLQDQTEMMQRFEDPDEDAE